MREAGASAARGRAGEPRPRRHGARHRGACRRRARGPPHACLVAGRVEEHGDAACLPGEGADAHAAVRPIKQRLAAGTASTMRRSNRNSAPARTRGRNTSIIRPLTAGNQDLGEIGMAGRLKGKIAVVTGGGAGHRARDRRSLVGEGATVYASDVSRDKLAGSGAGQEGTARRPVDAGRRGLCSEGGRRRHPRQRGRLRAPRHGADDEREGLGLFLRPQRQIHAPDDPGLPAGHAGAGQGERRRRLDRQHRVGRIVDPRHRRTAMPTAPARRR